MNSHLLSSLISRFKDADLAQFEKAHPHDWLVWEPGAWRAPQRTTMVVAQKLDLTGAPKGLEALALVLAAKKPDEQLVLGRELCDLVINDATLSQRHLLLMHAPSGGWTVRDAGSRNGSWFENTQMEPGRPHPLKSGTKLRAGQVQLTYYGPAEMFARIRGGR